MRKTVFAMMTLAGAASVASTAPAAAYDYPYCLQGRGIGVPDLCPMPGECFGARPLLQYQPARRICTAAAAYSVLSRLLNPTLRRRPVAAWSTIRKARC